MTQTIHIRGARTHNLQEHRPRAAARPPDRLHRPFRLRQVFARLRHDLRRGPAPLRRVAVRLRAAVPVDDGKAGRGLRSRASRPRSRSSRSRPRTTRARPSARSPRSTITCACCTRAPASRAARTTASTSTAQTVSQMVDQVLALPEGTAVALLAPVISGRKGEHLQVIEELRGKGFVRARVDGKYVELDAVPKLDPKKKHSIDAVVDRLKVRAGPPAAPRGILRDGAAPRRGLGARRLPRRAEARGARVLGQVRLPDLRLLACPSSSRGCSRSTTRSAPARAATASA